MPDWASPMANYGVLGVFALWLFGVAIPVVWKQLFSRDEKSLGLVVEKARVSVARDQKMIEFLNHMTARDDRQEKVSQHTNKGVGHLKEAAIVGCQAGRTLVDLEFPSRKADMDPYFEKIERMLGEA